MTLPRVHIATDHAGLKLRDYLIEHLRGRGFEVVVHGPAAYDAQDDYPAFCIRAAQAVIADTEAGEPALGIVLGGSGNGEQIAANKVQGIRAALAWNLETAKLARQHNDANVVAVGGRQHTVEEAAAIIDAFLDEPFSGAERHTRRINQIARFEATGELPADSTGTEV
ncbi:ribose-5-phosphate isomerase [Acaricomes phytoseiuli]|uniref:ribose-5-phosphate isomerase n=1 Tax=Acaricomes phytoseiuli TaxID=291968 RepID=UPI00222148DA|nr:ribose-5-phosphate isomerase [Acaricomes phytoseiuli]MCW1249979.1 ribose-5-phosphate isomerase [Acaricomes phytoseiuli]